MVIPLTPDSSWEKARPVVGEAPELDEATAAEMWRRADERDAYFDSHWDQLKRLYPDEFVAVRDENVIDHDADLGALDDRLRSQGLGVQDVWVEFIRTDWQLIL